MAIGWLTVVKMVPWGDVIENAPKVAVGARKLWDKVGKKPAAESAPTDTSVLPTPTLAGLQGQVAVLQQSVAELHQQMLDSTELIKNLAEQNTQLVKRVESSRQRVLWLALLLVLQTVWFVMKLN
jgi:hypothetical protein